MTEDAMPVRLSHLLRHCSVGAVVRSPDYLVTVKDTSLWKGHKDREIRHVERVRRSLRIDGKDLCTPPKARIEEDRVMGVTVPAMRFPGWTRCSSSPWQKS